MSATVAFVSIPLPFNHFRSSRNDGRFLFTTINPICRSSSKPSLSELFFRKSCGALKRNSTSTAARPFSPAMEWQTCTVKTNVAVPCSVAYLCYSDRESIPTWMPFASVKVLEDRPELSQWSLKYTAFGRDIEFSWLTRHMQPVPNQKIHWRSLDGIPNRGSMRFYPAGPSSCIAELTVSYEVPQVFFPVAYLMQPFLEGLLVRGLEQFAKAAESYSSTSKTPRQMIIP